VKSVGHYFEAADGRPEWALWGKAQPEATADVPAHPLLCHMVDVASVAEVLLRVVPRSTRARLLAGFGPDQEGSWLPFIVALHDLGKATPPFQMKWPPAIEWLARAGFDLQARGGREHGKLSVSLARESLVELGVEMSYAHQLARAVAAHHGAFPTDYDAASTPIGPEAGRNPTWREARSAVVRQLAEVYGVIGQPPPRPTHERDWAFMSAFAGFTATADWVGSMAEVFRYEPAPTSLADYLPKARERAKEALTRAGFRAANEVTLRTFDALFGFSPRPLQRCIAEVLDLATPPVCIVVEAPMGEGKTEAALFVSHTLDARHAHEGTYIGLPTQATANQMFNRLSEFLTRTRPDERINLQLLHGEAIFDNRVTSCAPSMARAPASCASLGSSARSAHCSPLLGRERSIRRCSTCFEPSMRSSASSGSRARRSCSTRSMPTTRTLRHFWSVRSHG